jgi:hypothetical protein
MSIGVASIEFVLANLLQNASSGKKACWQESLLARKPAGKEALRATPKQRALRPVAEGIRL